MESAAIVNMLYADILEKARELVTDIDTTYQNYDQDTIRLFVTTKTTDITPFTLIIVAGNDGDLNVAGVRFLDLTIEYDTTNVRQNGMHIRWDSATNQMVVHWEHRSQVRDLAQLHLFMDSLLGVYGGASFGTPLSQVPK